VRCGVDLAFAGRASTAVALRLLFIVAAAACSKSQSSSTPSPAVPADTGSRRLSIDAGFGPSLPPSVPRPPASAAHLFALAGNGQSAAYGPNKLREADLNKIIGGEDDCYGDPSVGAILKDGATYCSGTVIKPHSIVTAAHCFDDQPRDAETVDTSRFLYFDGCDATTLSSDGRTYHTIHARVIKEYSETKADNYDWDIAVLCLLERATAASIDIATDGPSSSQSLKFVGYGLSDADGSPSGLGQRRSVEMKAILDASDTLVFYNDVKGKNTCRGDSGGPALTSAGPIVGIVTVGQDNRCQARSTNLVAPLKRAWVIQEAEACESLSRKDAAP